MVYGLEGFRVFRVYKGLGLIVQGQTKGNSGKEVTAGGLRLLSYGTPRTPNLQLRLTKGPCFVMLRLRI